MVITDLEVVLQRKDLAGNRGHWRGEGRWRRRLKPVFRHDRGSRADVLLLVDVMIDDLHALQVFLNNFFPGQLDVLIGHVGGMFPNPINHVFFDEDANLFGKIGARGQFGHSLADKRAFRQIALPDANDILIR